MDEKVREIMTPNPVGVYAEQTIGETARLMRDANIGAVLVVSGEALAGVVTDRDLVIRGIAAGAGPDSPVGPLCTPKLVTVAADADLAEAEVLFRENAVRRLPVVEDSGQVVGVLSLSDLALAGDWESPFATISKAQPNS